MQPLSKHAQYQTHVDWTAIINDLRTWPELLRQIRSWGDKEELDQDDKELLAELSYGTLWPQPLQHWAGHYTPKEYEQVIDDYKTLVLPPARDFVPSKLALGFEKHLKNVIEIVKQAGTEHFQYKNFTVENSQRVPDKNLRNILDGIDYLLAVFKNRGVEPLLHKTLKKIAIRPVRTHELGAVSGSNPLGLYDENSQTLIVMTQAAYAGAGRLLKKFLHELFIHEIGHHVHLTLLSPEAKAEWDKGWEVHEKTKQSLKETDFSLRPEERKRYWEMLVRTKGNLGVIKRLLVAGLHLFKFQKWLEQEGLVGNNTLQWSSPKGTTLAQFLQDPRAKEMLQGNATSEPEFLQLWKHYTKIFALDTRFIVDLKDWKAYQEYKESAPAEKALGELGIPTEYGKKDVKEDFAETFVWFLLAPEKLSERALFRMKRALWLSGWYGKPIMRVAQHNRIWYHGTPKKFDAFQTQRKQTFGTGASETPLFFTPEESFARLYARGGTIFKVRLQWKKVFDSDNFIRSHQYWPPEREALTPEGQILYDDLAAGRIFPVSPDDWSVFNDSQGLFASILKHQYDVLESTEFKRWLKSRGYDAAYVRGDGPTNVFVFHPAQVEIIDRYSLS